MTRTASISRKTKETDITLSLNLDGSGVCNVSTGIGFFDHMLTSFSVHGSFDLDVSCKGDLDIDGHHTVEDVGIVLGLAFKEVLKDKSGIMRFGSASVPMDEALGTAVVDISGRAFLVFSVELNYEQIGDFDACLAEEFMRAFAFNSGITLHIKCEYGSNDHHKIEAIFKATARALKQAVASSGCNAILSTKGSL